MLGLKKLDWYIIRQFLGTYIYSILILSVIIIIFDVSEKIDDFTDERAADATLWNIIFDYYVNFVPFFVNQFNALFVFISVIFFTSKLASRTEIIAILTSGVSYTRLLRPYFIGAVFLTAVNLLMTLFIIPESSKVRIEFENRFIKNAPRFNERNIHLKLDENSYAYFQSFNINRNTGYQFSLESFDKQELKFKLLATFAKWDSVEQHWTIQDYMIREINGGEETIKTGREMDTALTITPTDFKLWENNTETMNQVELSEFIEREKLKGSDLVNTYLVEKYKRYAFPVASLILTMMGFAVASRKVRGGIGMHLGYGILLCATYIMFSQIFFVYASKGGIAPIIAVWIPNIIYTGITIYLLRKAQR